MYPDRSTTGRTLALIFALTLAVTGRPAFAQENGELPAPQQGVPVNKEANLIFDQALDAFKAGKYGMAFRRFRLVERDYRLHRKTTAAFLMAGKALYRKGDYAKAEKMLNTLISEYPTSSYLREARRVRSFARQQQDAAESVPETFQLGVLLPAPDGKQAAQTQALFNGIRLAVDQMNAGAQGLATRMVFQSTGSSSDEAAKATRKLISEDVDAIIGPLFSQQAVAAARVAERNETVLLTPLATDTEVSNGRQYVFQANPTFPVRGRQMADFTARSLITVDALAVVAERGSGLSEAMAEAFRREMRRNDRQLTFYKQLPGPQGWYDLSAQLGAGNVKKVDALYLPIAGSDADQRVIAALQGLDPLDDRVRILGNSTWKDLPVKQLASQHKVTYAKPFYVDKSRTGGATFRRQYKKLADRAPKRLAYTGYDVTRFLLKRRRARASRSLRAALHVPDTYEGLGLRIDFEDSNVNHGLFFLHYRRGKEQLLR